MMISPPPSRESLFFFHLLITYLRNYSHGKVKTVFTGFNNCWKMACLICNEQDIDYFDSNPLA